MALDPQIRTLAQTRTRTRRRSACHRHPNEPVTGLCALCLRDRLAGLDTSSDQIEVEHENIISFPFSRRTRGTDIASSSGTVPELRRSKSVAVEKCEVLNGLSLDLRRKSCDVRASNRLLDLFDIDDTKRESRISSAIEPVLEINEDRNDCNGIRVLDDDGEIGEEEDTRTMKELIEMELQNKKRNFWNSASVFSQKIRKWRQKNNEKKVINGGTDNKRSNFDQFKDPQIQSEVVDYKVGRRSCDVAPRFSIDAHCMTVEDPSFSYDEHRASWDGYMIARTIPRLTPMLPIVDDLMLPPVNKRIAVKEDVSSSSGVSAKSNSDSSSLNTGSSSSSMKSSSSKTANDVIIGYETKLVITESELKDWHLSSINKNSVESASNAINSGHKKEMTSRWRRLSNLWSYKHKLNDKKNGDYIHEKGPPVNRNNVINGVERVNSRNKSNI